MRRARSELEKAKNEAEKCRCTETEKHKVELVNRDKIGLENVLRERERVVSSEIKSSEFSKNQLEKAEKEKENLEAKISKLEITKQEFNNLRVENQKLENKNQSLEIQIKELKEYKLDANERKLEQLISGLKIDEKDKEQLEKLNEIYIEKGNNDIGVRRIEKNLRKDLLKKNKPKNVNEIFKISKEIAKLEAELAPINQTNKLSSEDKN
jgi:DNA repair ATPase RecN